MNKKTRHIYALYTRHISEWKTQAESKGIGKDISPKWKQKQQKAGLAMLMTK